MKDRIGIIMAGGKGTRLYPLTQVVNKHLLPVHDKPMIYYPLSTLIRLGHKIIYLITNKESINLFKNLIGNGSDLGVKINYRIQENSNGIANCFHILRKEITQKKTTLILGDNIFISNFEKLNERISQKGCTLILTTVREPWHYGVVEIKNSKIRKIEEKPKNPKSNFIATGLYFYDENLLNYVDNLKLSKRGEYEITDINKMYLKERKCNAYNLRSNDIWFDLGKFDDLEDCSIFLKIYQKKRKLNFGFLK